jgi:hypothetical protein
VKLLVQAGEQVDQLAAHGPGAGQVRRLRQVDEPLRIPRWPVIVGPAGDPEDTMAGLGRLRRRTASARTGPSRGFRATTHVYPVLRARQALQDLKAGLFDGAAVLASDRDTAR